ncbi:ribose 5-phosphate isomerase B [Arthrobacter sp. CAN_A214]|uniref:RpiB/LacA/LacB family sugar-phosphate isomerase n=1 Tax=Arthrobacter sp. CAN_A214 TaxID=2787720 RepID=UPI0018CBC5C1
MRIALGNDHAGFPLKDHVRKTLERLGHDVTDVGAPDTTPVDFPDISQNVANLVLSGDADRGVLVCGTGVGASIAANKVPGIRAMTAHETYSARQGVEHDDVNILCMGAWLIGPVIAEQVIEEYLAAEFSTDADCRRRVDKIHQLEQKFHSD